MQLPTHLHGLRPLIVAPTMLMLTIGCSPVENSTSTADTDTDGGAVETAEDASDTGDAVLDGDPASDCSTDGGADLPPPTRGRLLARRTNPDRIANDGRLDEFRNRWLTIEGDGDESDDRLAVSALWTADYLHLGIRVRDSSVETPESAPLWNQDSVEFAWAPDSATSENVRKWTLTADGTLQVGEIRSDSWEQPEAAEETRHTVRGTDNGYRVELTLPWSVSNLSATEGLTRPVCLRDNDRDDGAVTRLGCRSDGDFGDPASWTSFDDTLELVTAADVRCRGERDAGPSRDTRVDDGGGEPGEDPEYEEFDRRGETVSVGSIPELQTAVEEAAPGDLVVLDSGTYSEDIRIEGASGRPNHPITITGEASNPSDYPVIDGGDAMGDSGSCMVLEDLSWVTVENLRFENCWDKTIVLRNTQYMTVDAVDFRSASHPVFVADNGDSHHVLIQHSHWKATDESFWSQVAWETVKHDDSSDYGTLTSSSILDGESRGANVIRHNELSYAFQGYRNRFSAKTLNTEFYGNYVHHIRDNAIEPEGYLFNFHVYHNRFDQIDPGMISVDSDDGGLMYLWGNVGWYNPKDPSHRNKNRGVAGNIFKMVTTHETYIDRPMYVLHNSFYNYRLAFKPNRYQKNIKHFNNAYHLNSGMWLGGWGDRLNDGNEFDYDAAANGWDDELDAYGHEQNGLKNTEPQFRDPENGDFRLEPDSPLIDAGRTLDGFHRDYQGSAPDIGAYEGDSLVKGPTFFIRKPDDGLTYRERPRVTRYQVSESTLTAYFSWPLDATTVDSDAIALFDDGRRVEVSEIDLGDDGRRLEVTTDRSLDDTELDLCFEPLPAGTNDRPVTYWASTLGCR